MTDNKESFRHTGRKRRYRTLGINLIILAVSILMLFPLLWIIVTACKPQIEILKNPLALIPENFYFIENLKTVWQRADWLVYYKNSIVLTFCVWAVQMLVSIPAAYAFATFKFRWKDVLFILILTRLMVSPESTMLANYLTVLKLNAYDSMLGVILPYVVSAQAIFIFRQAFRQLPPELRESARIDGCGDLGFLWRIALPNIRPYIMSFSIITCIFQWNAFFWPMLIMKTKSKRVLSVALTFFGLQAESGAEWGVTMMAVLLVITPMMLLFMIFQKKFIDSFTSSGVK